MVRKTLVQQLVEIIEDVESADDRHVGETAIAQAIVDAGWRPTKSSGPAPGGGLDREHLARSLEAYAERVHKEAAFYYDHLVANAIRGLADDMRAGRVVLDGPAAGEVPR